MRVLELTEEVVRLKLALEDTIREGTFAFSRQRYARGPHAVSESHYDLNTMRATTKMRAESARSTVHPASRRPGPRRTRSTWSRRPEPKPEPEPEPKPAARSGKADDDGLRRRPKVKTNTEKFLEDGGVGTRGPARGGPAGGGRDDGKRRRCTAAHRRRRHSAQARSAKAHTLVVGLPSSGDIGRAEAGRSRVHSCARVAEVESELRALTARAQVDAVQLREVGDPS